MAYSTHNRRRVEAWGNLVLGLVWWIIAVALLILFVLSPGAAAATEEDCWSIPPETCLQPTELLQVDWAREYGFSEPERAPEICQRCMTQARRRDTGVPHPVPSFARWEHQAKRRCAAPLKSPCSSLVSAENHIPNVPSIGAVRREEILARYPGMVSSLSCEVLDSPECRLGWSAHMATGFVFETQFANRDACICNGWLPTAECIIDVMYSSDRDSCAGAYACLPHCRTPPPPQPVIVTSGPVELAVGSVGTYNSTATNCTPAPEDWEWETTGDALCTGEPDGASLGITCAEPGALTVRARAPAACGSAHGALVITVTDDAPPPPPPPEDVLELHGSPSGNLIIGPPPAAGGGVVWVWHTLDGEGRIKLTIIDLEPEPPNSNDRDHDTVPDSEDNCIPPAGESCAPHSGFATCPWRNPGQVDRDGDGIGDRDFPPGSGQWVCDQCPREPGPPPTGCPEGE